MRVLKTEAATVNKDLTALRSLLEQYEMIKIGNIQFQGFIFQIVSYILSFPECDTSNSKTVSNLTDRIADLEEGILF